MVKVLVSQLRPVMVTITEYDRHIEALVRRMLTTNCLSHYQVLVVSMPHA